MQTLPCAPLFEVKQCWALFFSGFSGLLPRFSANQTFGGALATPAPLPPTPLLFITVSQVISLAVTFANANDLAKKMPTQKRTDMLKKLIKTYYGKITLQTTQTHYFKQVLSYPKHFCKFFRISNALKEQRFSLKLKG